MFIDKRSQEEIRRTREENALKLPEGTRVEHKTFGTGTVESLDVEKGRINIRFEGIGMKMLTLTEIFHYITIV